ncbi:hypothetical protein EDC94DRAFT_600383, partial [Helicostylum pulchrum]
ALKNGIQSGWWIFVGYKKSKTAKTRVTSHSVIGAIRSSAVLHVVFKKPPPKPELDTVAKKKRKGNGGKKRGV